MSATTIALCAAALLAWLPSAAGAPTCYSGCPDGSPCQNATTCDSGVCRGFNVTLGYATCQVPRCDDGVRNGIETDNDCGGTCAGCGGASLCFTGGDCESGICGNRWPEDSMVRCQAPTCTDAVKNGLEADVDCGISCCPPDTAPLYEACLTRCRSGYRCKTDRDCFSGRCAGVPAMNNDKFCSAGRAAVNYPLFTARVSSSMVIYGQSKGLFDPAAFASVIAWFLDLPAEAVALEALSDVQKVQQYGPGAFWDIIETNRYLPPSASPLPVTARRLQQDEDREGEGNGEVDDIDSLAAANGDAASVSGIDSREPSARAGRDSVTARRRAGASAPRSAASPAPAYTGRALQIQPPKPAPAASGPHRGAAEGEGVAEAEGKQLEGRAAGLQRQMAVSAPATPAPTASPSTVPWAGMGYGIVYRPRWPYQITSTDTVNGVDVRFGVFCEPEEVLLIRSRLLRLFDLQVLEGGWAEEQYLNIAYMQTQAIVDFCLHYANVTTWDDAESVAYLRCSEYIDYDNITLPTPTPSPVPSLSPGYIVSEGGGGRVNVSQVPEAYAMLTAWNGTRPSLYRTTRGRLLQGSGTLPRQPGLPEQPAAGTHVAWANDAVAQQLGLDLGAEAAAGASSSGRGRVREAAAAAAAAEGAAVLAQRRRALRRAVADAKRAAPAAAEAFAWADDAASVRSSQPHPQHRSQHQRPQAPLHPFHTGSGSGTAAAAAAAARPALGPKASAAMMRMARALLLEHYRAGADDAAAAGAAARIPAAAAVAGGPASGGGHTGGAVPGQSTERAAELSHWASLALAAEAAGDEEMLTAAALQLLLKPAPRPGPDTTSHAGGAVQPLSQAKQAAGSTHGARAHRSSKHGRRAAVSPAASPAAAATSAPAPVAVTGYLPYLPPWLYRRYNAFLDIDALPRVSFPQVLARFMTFWALARPASVPASQVATVDSRLGQPVAFNYPSSVVVIREPRGQPAKALYVGFAFPVQPQLIVLDRHGRPSDGVAGGMRCTATLVSPQTLIQQLHGTTRKSVGADGLVAFDDLSIGVETDYAVIQFVVSFNAPTGLGDAGPATFATNVTVTTQPFRVLPVVVPPIIIIPRELLPLWVVLTIIFGITALGLCIFLCVMRRRVRRMRVRTEADAAPRKEVPPPELPPYEPHIEDPEAEMKQAAEAAKLVASTDPFPRMHAPVTHLPAAAAAAAAAGGSGKAAERAAAAVPARVTRALQKLENRLTAADPPQPITFSLPGTPGPGTRPGTGTGMMHGGPGGSSGAYPALMPPGSAGAGTRAGSAGPAGSAQGSRPVSGSNVGRPVVGIGGRPMLAEDEYE